MKVTVKRDAFSDAIDAAFRAAHGAPNIPVLKNVLLAPGDNRLSISATNLVMSATAEVDAEVAGNGDGITVVGDALDRIIGLLPQGAQVSVEWDGNGPAVITSGRARYRLNTLPAADFPQLEAVTYDVNFMLPAQRLAKALGAVRFAISPSETRVYLSGAFLHVRDNMHPAFGTSKGKSLLLTATDACDFGRVALDLPKGAERCDGVIISDASIDEIARICKQAAGEEVELSISKSLLRVRAPGMMLVTKMIDATYPDYYKAVPSENNLTARVASKDLLQALARVASLGDNKKASVGFSAGEMQIKAYSSNSGEAEEGIEIEYEGEPIDFAFKISGWKECIEAADCDVCLISMSHDHGGVLFHPIRNGNIDYSSVFLSMKIMK